MRISADPCGTIRKRNADLGIPGIYGSPEGHSDIGPEIKPGTVSGVGNVKTGIGPGIGTFKPGTGPQYRELKRACFMGVTTTPL